VTFIAFTVFAVSASGSAALESSTHDAQGLTPLHLAAGRGDTAEVKRLIDSGADLLVLDSKMGVSVLHKAVYSGNAQTVELLLNRGAFIDLQSPSNGNTPLHDALYFKRGDDLSVIKLLLNHGASQSIRNRAGLIAIESARILGDKEAEKLLQAHEAQRQSQASRDLLSAVKGNDLAHVQEILAKEKFKLDETDEQGFSPLLWAAREGYTPIVKVLLDAGANPNQNDQWMGATAGHKAGFWGRTEAMKLLISHGLNLNARGGYNGYTALMDAVTRNHLETAKSLVDAGADVEIRGHDNLNAIDIARLNQNQEMSKMLLAAPTANKHQ
jgi:ankyrin repeat protein